MKTFKKLVSEVAQPKSPEERAFKDQHIVQKFDYPVKDSDAIFKGTVEKKKRPADYDATSDKAAYDKATPEKAPFKMPRNVDESVELDEEVHTVDIDHMGGHDANAKKHNISLAHHKHGAYAVGKKKDLQKYLVKHYDDHDDAKANHPEVFKESVEQIDEISADLAKKVLDKRDAQAAQISKGSRRADTLKNVSLYKAKKRRDREMGTNTSKEREIRKHVDTAKKADAIANNLKYSAIAKSKKADKTYDYMKKRGMKTESAEQIDEISKDLAGRYIKKAQISTADAGRDTMDDRPHIRKRGINKIVNRRMGTADAIRKLTGKARVAATEAYDEPASPDEASMAKKQAEFIQYVAKEIGEHLDANKEFPEWMQNKLSALHQSAKDYHSHLGAHGMDEEAAVTEAKKITAKDMKRALAGMKVKGKDEVSLKKAPWEKKEDVNEVTQSATKKMVNVTGPDGKVRTVMKKTKTTQYDDKGQEKIKTNEEVEYIDEAVKVGNMKLRDGSSVKVTKEDAKLLNQMFKDLNSANRRKMEQVMMTDKAGFEEIRGFAREAL